MDGSCEDLGRIALCQDVQVYLFTKSVQIDFLELIDRSTVEPVVILKRPFVMEESCYCWWVSWSSPCNSSTGGPCGKLQPTEVASVRQVLTAAKSVRGVQVSQTRCTVSLTARSTMNGAGCTFSADTPALECARTSVESVV